jgi:hypothetical protein
MDSGFAAARQSGMTMGASSPQHAGLQIEHGGGEAVAVLDQFLHDGERIGAPGFDFADDAAEVEGELCVEFARELLHAPVVGQASHVQLAIAAITRSQQGPAQQRRADAVALPGFSTLIAASACPGKRVPS